MIECLRKYPKAIKNDDGDGEIAWKNYVHTANDTGLKANFMSYPIIKISVH